MSIGEVERRTVPRLNKKLLSRQRSTELILDCALKLVVQKGFREMTVEQVAEAASLTKGAVYHYFQSKEDLLLAVLNQIEKDSIHVLPKAETPRSAADAVVHFIHTQANQAFRHPDRFLFLIVLLADFSTLGEKVGQKVDGVFTRIRKALEDIIKRGREAGEFSCLMPEQDIALFFIATFCGNVLQWHRSGRKRKVGAALVRGVRLSVLGLVGVKVGERG